MTMMMTSFNLNHVMSFYWEEDRQKRKEMGKENGKESQSKRRNKATTEERGDESA